MWYAVIPWSLRSSTSSMFDNCDNVKRIIYSTLKDYNFRLLDESKFVSNYNEIYIGTYPAEISDYLHYLRFNIRKS